MDFNSWLTADLPSDGSEDESDVDFVPKEDVDSDAASYEEDESGPETGLTNQSPIEIGDSSPIRKSKARKSSRTKSKRGTEKPKKRRNTSPVSNEKELKSKRKRDGSENEDEEKSKIAIAKKVQNPSPKKSSTNVESFPKSLLQPGRVLEKTKLPIPLYSNDLEKIIEDRKNHYISLCQQREFLANTKIPDLVRTETETRNDLKTKKSALAEQQSRNARLLDQINRIMTGVGVVAMNMTQRADPALIPTNKGTKSKQSRKQSSKDVSQQGEEWERQENVEWFLESLSNRVQATYQFTSA